MCNIGFFRSMTQNASNFSSGLQQEFCSGESLRLSSERAVSPAFGAKMNKLFEAQYCWCKFYLNNPSMEIYFSFPYHTEYWNSESPNGSKQFIKIQYTDALLRSIPRCIFVT